MQSNIEVKKIKKILKSEHDNKTFIILQLFLSIAFVCSLLLMKLRSTFVSEGPLGMRQITDEASYKGVGIFIYGAYVLIIILTVFIVKNSAYSAAIHSKELKIIPLNNVETFTYGTTEFAKGIDQNFEAYEGAICKKCLNAYKSGNYNKVYYVGIKTNKIEVDKIVFLNSNI